MLFQNYAGYGSIFKIYCFQYLLAKKMFRFRLNGRPIRHIFHRFQNVLVSCERSLIYLNFVFSNTLAVIL